MYTLARVGAVALLLGAAAAQSSVNSCRYAHDGECDDPAGTDLCALGTDDADCCPGSNMHSVDRTHCQCDAGYRITGSGNSCVRSSTYAGSNSYGGGPAPPASYSSYGRGDEEEAVDDFDGASGLLAVIYLFLIMVIVFFPCIVFCCAHEGCIKSHSRQGSKPTDTAWMVCGTLFGVAILSMFTPFSLLWFILPFFMIIPFCCEDCYYNPDERQRGAGPQVTVIQQTVSPLGNMQMTPVQQQGVYAPQPQGMYAQPVMATAMAAPQPQPVVAQAVVAQPYQPPAQAAAAVVQTSPSAPPSYYTESAAVTPSPYAQPAGGTASLHDFLISCNLGQYEMQLQEMGALQALDLRDVTEPEYEGMGMKKLEIKRLYRSLAALQGQSTSL